MRAAFNAEKSAMQQRIVQLERTLDEKVKSAKDVSRRINLME